MAVLTVTGTFDYSVNPPPTPPPGDQYVLITFATSGFSRALFAASQFGIVPALISDLVTVQGDTQVNIISVQVTGNFDASGWNFLNWTDTQDLSAFDGNASANTITGTTRDDGIEGKGGADSLFGGDGDDAFYVSQASDVVAGDLMSGGNGTDTILVENGGTTDLRVATLSSIEQLGITGTVEMTSAQANGLNYVYSYPGNSTVQTLHVYGSNTNLSGITTFNSWGNEDIVSIEGDAVAANNLTGSSKADMIAGGSANDIFKGGAGNDQMAGGAGIDRADYDVAVNAATFTKTSIGWTITTSPSDTDTLQQIETAQFINGTVTLRQARGDFNFGSATNDTGATSDFLIYNAAGQFSSFMVQSDAVATTQYLGQADGWAAIANGVGDFNGDGRSDFLTTKAGSILNYTTNSAGNVASVTFLGYVPGWNVKGTGDFNNDGRLDILLQNGSTLAVWQMAANGSLSATINYGSTGGWDAVAVGDFNRDGRADVFLRNAATGELSEYLTNAGGVGGTLQAIGTLPNWSIVGSGDFNGDGGGDLLLRDTVGNVITWITAANGGIGAGFYLGIVPGWTIAGSGDYNGDGTSDVLLQNGANLVSWDIVNGQLAGSHLVSGSLAGWTAVG